MKIGGGLTFLRYLEGVQLALTGVGYFENEHLYMGVTPLCISTQNFVLYVCFLLFASVNNVFCPNLFSNESE